MRQAVVIVGPGACNTLMGRHGAAKLESTSALQQQPHHTSILSPSQTQAKHTALVLLPRPTIDRFSSLHPAYAYSFFTSRPGRRASRRPDAALFSPFTFSRLTPGRISSPRPAAQNDSIPSATPPEDRLRSLLAQETPSRDQPGDQFTRVLFF